MAEKHNVAMFVQGEDGRRVQVGWASPKDASGVRTFEYSPGYEETRPKDVSFEDDELTQLVAEEQHDARTGDGNDGEEFAPVVEQSENEPLQENLQTVHDIRDEVTPLPAEPIVDAPDEEKAAEPIDDPTEDVVELDNGGKIVDPDEDEEAEFERLLAEEEAQKNQPQSRREARENEENN